MLALALLCPAFAAASESDFANPLAEFIGSGRSPSFQRVTQESDPNDPVYRAQKEQLDLIKRVISSVVLLEITKPNKRKSLCSGFFADAQEELGYPGIITTNAHCVQNVPIGTEIDVGLYSGPGKREKMVKGKVLAYGNSHSGKDIAFIELLDSSLKTPPPLRLWTKLDIGETVIAIGNGRGLGISVTYGIISALKLDDLDQLEIGFNQSDVAINPGNSGGPLFNMWGSVIGINTSLITESGGSEGISMSMPASFITLAMRQYKRTGNLTPGSLQARILLKTMIVEQVAPAGSAAKAQLRVGDRLIALGEQVDDIDLGALSPTESAYADLITFVKYHSPGEKIKVKVRRDDKDVVLWLILGEELPQDPKWNKIPKKNASSELEPQGV